MSILECDNPRELETLTFGFVRIGDEEAARKLLQLCEERMTGRPDAVMHSNFEGSEHRTLMLAGDDDMLMIGFRDNELILTCWNCTDETVWLKVIDGRLWAREDSDTGFALTLADKAATYAVDLPYLVPYAYVQDGVVKGFIYNTEPGWGGGPGFVLVSGTAFYVLEGEPWPHVFDNPDSASEACALTWRAVDDGVLVRMGERVNRQPGPVRSVWDGQLLAIEFTDTDGESPVLAPDGKRYLSWYPDEQSPGSSGRPYTTQSRTTDLRGWFRP